ncbi:hypothetical protein V3851_26020 [Paenibacillus sp. M1]|uniref:Phage-related protein n=1 Tax=Paenibacillus haidiansis TaxID=1574488 RepID=A0ABU7VZN6_9BACL
MSNSVGQIDLDLGLNYGAFNQQLNGIAGKASGMVGGAFKKLGGIIAGAFAVGVVVNFSKEAINLASDLQEVQNVVDVTFGSMSAEVNAWSQNLIESFGLSELSAKRYSSTMGAMLKSSGLTGEAMKNMSLNLTQLAADMSSFYNLAGDEAFYKVFSGLTGEIEPLKQLGINMSVANMEAFALSQGITKSWMSMTQAEQTLLRYNYLLSVTKDAQGDFARTSDSWANQTRILTEQWKIFQGTMGAGFINILTPIVKGLNLIVRKLQIAAEYFKAFTELIFGNANEVSNATGAAAAATSQTSDAMGDMGAATQDAGKKVKKAGKDVKGSLAGFDQLNTLSQATAAAMSDTADAAGSGLGNVGVGAVDLGSLTTGELDLGLDTGKLDSFKQSLAGIKDIASGVWQTLKETFGPSIQTALNELMPVLAGWKEQFRSMFSDIQTLGAPLANWVMTGLVPLWQQGIELAGHVLAGLGDSVLMVVESIWDAAFPILEKFVTEGLPRLTEFLMGAQDIFRSLFDLIKQVFDDIWQDAVDPAMQLISHIIQDTLDIIFGWWDEWGGKIVDGVKKALDGIKDLWSSLWDGFLEPFVSNMLEMLTWLWDEHLKGLVDEIGVFIGKLIDGALEIYNKFILPLISYLVDKLGPTFSNIFSLIGDVIGTALAVIVDVAKGIIKALGGIIDFIVGVFTGDWEKAWEGIKTVFSGIFDAVVGIFKGAINLIIDALNFMIRQLNKVKIDIPDWVQDLTGAGETFGFNIPTIPKLAKGGLAYGPTLAMVGDNRGAAADPEVISPLSKLQEMLGGSNQAVVEVLMLILDAIRNQDNRAVLQIGETEFGKAAIKAINSAQRQAGRTLLNV